MDHNLHDSIILDGSIEVDFEEGDTVVEAVSNIEIPDVQDDMSMEFDTIHEQPILMETEGEEIIEISEFGGEQFVLDSEYIIPHEDKPSLSLESGIDGNTIVESIATTSSNSNSLLRNKMTDFQFDQESLIESVVTTSLQAQPVNTQPTFIKIQKQNTSRDKAAISRPVPIAPKPPATKIITTTKAPTTTNYSIVKPIPIAPKQVNANINPSFKKIQLLTQVGGKQHVMMVPQTGQKFKVVHRAGGIQYLKDEDEIYTENTSEGPNTKSFKVIVQGKASDFSNQAAVLTKVVKAQQPVTVVTVNKNKNVPVLNKVTNRMINVPIQLKPKHVVAVSPSKVLPVTVSSPTKLLPTFDTVGGQKVYIPASPARKVIIKPLRKPPPQPALNVTSGPSRSTRLHQVHIPGKGLQYIRLMTEHKNAETSSIEADPPKKYIMTYNKATGNVLQVEENKPAQLTAAPLVVTSGKVHKFKNQNNSMKMTSANKTITRSPQSLLAPIMTNKSEQPSRIPSTSDGEEQTETEDMNDSKEELRKALAKDNMDVRRVTSQPQEISWKLKDMKPDPFIPDVFTPDAYKGLANAETYSKNQSFNDQDNQIDLSPNEQQTPTEEELNSRPRKACNCTKSQCLKLYCECFANGEFCKDCNCVNCHNNLGHDEARRNAIMGCLERNPDAFRPKIGKAKSSAGPSTIRRHNKGCNCKRSGCLKNYCECYEAKIACTAKCKCVGCRNVEDGGERARKLIKLPRIMPKPRKEPCRLLTSSVIEAAVQCLLAAATPHSQKDAVRAVLTEYARCLHAVIAAARHAQAIT